MTRGLSSGFRTLWEELSLYGTDDADILKATGPQRFVFGEGGNDYLQANRTGDSYLYGGDDDDRLASVGDNNYLHGGDGNDWASYKFAAGGVHVDLAVGASFKFEQGQGLVVNDTLVDIENLEGSNHNDLLFGDDGANTLLGAGGNDTIFGRDGEDFIDGGLNAAGAYGDVLYGGADKDTFFFDGHASNGTVGQDIIMDFSQAEGDTIFIGSSNIDGLVIFSGEATNYSAFATEIWYQHGTDAQYGDVTYIHAQFHSATNVFNYHDIMLDGHIDLTAADFETWA